MEDDKNRQHPSSTKKAATLLLTLTLCGIVVIVVAANLQATVLPGGGDRRRRIGSHVHEIDVTANYLRDSARGYAYPYTRLFGSIATLGRTAAQSSRSRQQSATTTVAFLGNSMLYFNDFPRFFEEICGGHVVQNSCLHGGASISSLLDGSGMYPKFKTRQAILGKDDQGNTIHDYGACTVPQLLVGRDDRVLRDDTTGSRYLYEPGNINPCSADAAYRGYSTYVATITAASNIPWDYVVINDNTLNPARRATRQKALRTLEQYYVPWLLETKSTPVFLWTYAYSLENRSCESRIHSIDAPRDMTGLEDIAKFTSLTGVGYRAYVDLLKQYLPSTMAPRIAPVGLAYLVVHEENYELWKTLFHCDGLHASPSGSFLQGCIMYYTLFHQLPNKEWMLREHNMGSLWRRARMMQHAWEPPNPFPDVDTAKYLYHVAERVMIDGHVPKSYINYQNGEVA